MAYGWARRGCLALVLLVGACGFTPMYARSPNSAPLSSPVAAELSSIRIYGIDNRQGQILRNLLVRGFTPYGEPADPRYGLTVKLSIVPQRLAPNVGGYSTFTLNDVTAEYTLTDMATGRPLLSTTARSIAGTRNFGARYASIAAERDSEDRALTEIAQNISSQLGAWFADPRHRIGRTASEGSAEGSAASSPAPASSSPPTP